jgi:excisionase family DNA binding protein
MANYLTIEELAKMLQVSRATIYNYINSKGLPFVKVGRLTRFDAAEINKWINQQNSK